MRAEQAHLAHVGGAEMRRADRDDPVDAVQQGSPRAKAVQGAHLDQAFQGALAHLAQVDPAGKIIQITECPVAAPLQDRIHRSLPDILHRPQPEADRRCAVRRGLRW